MNRLLSKIIVAIGIACKSLITHKARSILTLIGIVIGISTVTIIVSSGEGLKGYIVGQIQGFGANVIFVEARPPENTLAFTLITTLKVDQMHEIVDNSKAFPHVRRGYGYAAGQDIARSKYEEITVDIMGTNEDFIYIDSATVAKGRFFTDHDEKSMKRVIVLGYDAAKKLYPIGDPIDKKIKIGNHTFTIIGVLKEKGPDLMMNMDKMVFMPLKNFQKLFSGTDWIPYFAIQIDDPEYIQESKAAIIAYLKRSHGIKKDDREDFAATTSDEAVEMVNSVLVVVSVLLLCLALISLIVGGVGIMNIMYVTVSERTREIGLRKSVGAKYVDILLQFLSEAVIITTIGGIIGIVAGIAVTYLMSVYAQNAGYNWDYIISVDAITVAFIVTILCGVVAGLAPSTKAAKMDPITALRYD